MNNKQQRSRSNSNSSNEDVCKFVLVCEAMSKYEDRKALKADERGLLRNIADLLDKAR